MTECPKYRTRLFLSVDLVGSTAFKAGAGDKRVDGSANPIWVDETKKFYREFPTALRAKFHQQIVSSGGTEYKDAAPQLWKTIGDEVLFCCRVRSRDHLVCVMNAFIQALAEYGGLLEIRGNFLDVKGTAWTADFPSPNVTVQIQASSPNDTLPDEEVEITADSQPHQFDFLGRGMDCGFRLARFSSADKLVVAAELAFVLCEAADANGHKFLGSFDYSGREVLKGVIFGRPYPVISIVTERSEARREVLALERMVHGSGAASALTLRNFLAKFINIEELDIPFFPAKESAVFPRHYVEFQSTWEVVATEQAKREQSLIESERVEADVDQGEVPTEVEAALKNIKPPPQIVPP